MATAISVGAKGYLGLRVVRMPNWSHGDADGVEGTVGTVIYYDNPNFSVIVRWDDGNEISYAYRSPDLQYELLIFGTLAPILFQPSRIEFIWWSGSR